MNNWSAISYCVLEKSEPAGDSEHERKCVTAAWEPLPSAAPSQRSLSGSTLTLRSFLFKKNKERREESNIYIIVSSFTIPGAVTILTVAPIKNAFGPPPPPNPSALIWRMELSETGFDSLKV